MFQSTPLREGRPGIISNFELTIKFQSTPLREGRPLRAIASSQAARFNPRPCARGDSIFFFMSSSDCVSIHAPARGATQYLRN